MRPPLDHNYDSKQAGEGLEEMGIFCFAYDYDDGDGDSARLSVNSFRTLDPISLGALPLWLLLGPL